MKKLVLSVAITVSVCTVFGQNFVSTTSTSPGNITLTHPGSLNIESSLWVSNGGTISSDFADSDPNYSWNSNLLVRNNNNDISTFSRLAFISQSGGTGAISVRKTGDYTGDMYFQVRNGAGFFQTPLLIKANGNVGMGTTTPSSLLHLNSAVERNTFRIYKNTTTNNYLSIWQGDGAAAIDPIGTAKLYLGYDATTDVYVNGKLGLGTTSPQEKLHVEGNIFVNTNQVQFQSSNGGVNRIYSVGGSSGLGAWSFKSRFDNIIIDAGENADNYRRIQLKTGGVDRMTVDYFGNVGIGTTNPTQKLEVNGTIYSREVKVDLAAGTGPDYVFEPNYKLLSLEEIKTYIDQHKHLPEVPSAKEMETNGVNVSEMNMLLLRKIEELTLHVIEQSKQIEELKSRSVSPDLSGKKIEELTLHVIELKKELNDIKQNKN